MPHLSSDWHVLISGALRVGDVLIVALAAVLAFVLRHESFDIPAYYQWAIALGCVLTFNYMHMAGVYAHSGLESAGLQLVRSTLAWGGVMLTLLTLAYFSSISDWFNREWSGLWFVLTALGFALLRAAAAAYRRKLRARGALKAAVAIVGARGMAQTIIHELRELQRDSVRVIGVWDDYGPLPETLEGAPVRGGINDLVALTRRERVDDIILAMVDRPEDEVAETLRKLRLTPVQTRLCAHSLRFNIPARGFSNAYGLPLLHVYERPLKGWSGVIKRLEDLLLGVLFMIPALPVMAVVALLIKLDSPGPVIFRQKRYGFNNNEITVWKFRSMYVNQPIDPKITQARKGDPRITRIGGFLRKTSLDEFPQLFNVLSGQMSLVGPRPHAVAHNEQYAEIIDGYLGRHRVKPGITGWAQVNGYRGETDTPDKMRLRVEHDLYYIDNWSLLLDLKILAMTFLVGFIHKNAY